MTLRSNPSGAARTQVMSQLKTTVLARVKCRRARPRKRRERRNILLLKMLVPGERVVDDALGEGNKKRGVIEIYKKMVQEIFTNPSADS